MTAISTFTKNQKRCFSILVYFIIPLAGMNTDIYLPSLPAMSVHFHVTKTLVQLTVTTYLVAMGIGQLIAGPISDALGRKKLLLIAILSQIIATLAILFSPSIYWILCFRFIQGAGAAFMMVPARAVINDIFSGPELKKKINSITMVFAIGPIVSPFIGGYLQHYFGWQANFIFVLIYAVILLMFLCILYQETIIKTHPLLLKDLWKNYQLILSHKHFLLSGLFASFMLGYFALFGVVGPFMVQVVLHKNAVVYGHIALLLGLAWFLGNTLNRLLFRYDSKTKTQFALWFIVIAVLILLMFAQLGLFNLISLTIPIFIMILFSALMFSIYVSECMVIFTDLSASANGCLFSMTWIIFSGYTTLATLLKAHSLFPLSITYLGVILVSLLFYYIFVRKLKLV
ncbi:MAG: multidrug effflux MFS transporter [Pseudomonadota bacterium]